MQVTVEHEDASEVWIRVISNEPPQSWASLKDSIPLEVRQRLYYCSTTPFKWTPGFASDWLDEGETPEHECQFEDFFYFRKAISE